MIASLLIANRGEIACRVIRTARRLGIRTVAVYSDADHNALHVRQADDAVHIGASPAAESYLRGDRIIAAAKETRAEAVHPGYGFLSENADFAQAVIDAGLIWVGPSPASIRAMGLKDAAKTLMAGAGVPVTPGYLGQDQSEIRLAQQAEAIGYPVLIKAVAGGGGKGMRLVNGPQEFDSALESCKREAHSSFGNDRVLLEKWIDSPRHIEVQVFGDTHGNVVHLFERDCSLQRRHQKVIEEAPAPGMNEATRTAICDAAVRAAKAVDYVGAGTIEFIADASEGLRADRIWFMEMNTRLQVEHPVTEEITGVDLVEWQLRVASGEELPLRQDEIAIDGHAIEARLYAEDPAKGFLPSTGKLEHLMLPEHLIRVDTGVDESGNVSPFYDPMIAKLVSHAKTRADAIAELTFAIGITAVWPVKTNASFLLACLHSRRFRGADLDTGLIATEGDALIAGDYPPDAVVRAGAKAVAVQALGQQVLQIGSSLTGKQAIFASPISGLFGFRLNREPEHKVHLLIDGEHFATIVDDPFGELEAWVETCGSTVLSGVNDGRVFAIKPDRTSEDSLRTASSGAILAPMPGKVIALDVAEGQDVAQGERLMVLEAMKMEHALTAPFAGRVAALSARLGAQVEVEALLARIEKGEGE